jgi:hypothetical protein
MKAILNSVSKKFTFYASICTIFLLLISHWAGTQPGALIHCKYNPLQCQLVKQVNFTIFIALSRNHPIKINNQKALWMMAGQASQDANKELNF